MPRKIKIIFITLLLVSLAWPQVGQSQSLSQAKESSFLQVMHSISSHTLLQWGLKPAGDNGTYFQAFPIAYTLVFPPCEVIMHIPFKGATIKKYYHYFDEFIPGSTSASGEITAEVVYVGYGVTAPELGLFLPIKKIYFLNGDPILFISIN